MNKLRYSRLIYILSFPVRLCYLLSIMLFTVHVYILHSPKCIFLSINRLSLIHMYIVQYIFQIMLQIYRCASSYLGVLLYLVVGVTRRLKF